MRALLSGEAAREIAEVARTVTKIETAIEPRFQEHFVRAMAFPHATDPYPNLAAGGATPGPPTGGQPHLAPTPARPAPDRRTPDHERRLATGAAEAAPPARPARLAAHIETVPFLTRTLTPVEVLNEEGVELIEHNADTILEQVGVIFRDYPEALSILADGGADVDGDRVRFPRGMCRRIVRRPRRRVHPARPQPGPQRARSAATPRCWRRTTARPSSTTSTAAAATPRWPTSRTS